MHQTRLVSQTVDVSIVRLQRSPYDTLRSRSSSVPVALA